MKFVRDRGPRKGQCFVIMPFGKKPLEGGTEFDWDEHWKNVLEPSIREVDMEPSRADEIFGAKPLMDRIWKGIQEAEVVVADLTGRSPNVLYELGLAHVIGKRILLLTMEHDDVPADLAHLVQIRYSTEGMELLKFAREFKKNLHATREEPAEEFLLSPMMGGGTEKIAAEVLSVNRDFATVRLQDGRRAFLNSEDFSWVRRRPDLTRLLKAGQELDGAFIADVNKGEARYSLAAVHENPWPKIESEFEIGQTFHGSVKAHPSSIGAFVPVKYGIDGLIPEPSIPVGIDLPVGARIEASVVRIDADKREVELRLIQVEDRPVGPDPPEWGPYTVGQRFSGSIVHQNQERGFCLVELPDGFTALMPSKEMSDRLHSAFQDGELEIGRPVEVEIVFVDDRRKRLTLREASEAESEGKGAEDQETA